MIEGIDYYPKRGKSKYTKFKLGIVILVLTAIVFYYFSNDGQIAKSAQKKLIVIKEPEIEKAKIIVIPVNIETSASEAKLKTPEVLENLDEMIQIHQKQ